jgi:hypothetical protein
MAETQDIAEIVRREVAITITPLIAKVDELLREVAALKGAPLQADALLTMQQAAKRLNVKASQTAEERLREGRIELINVGKPGARKQLRVRADDLERFINRTVMQNKSPFRAVQRRKKA